MALPGRFKRLNMVQEPRNMWKLVARRVVGILVVGFAVAYWAAKIGAYDAPSIDLPNEVHSPAFWGVMAVIGAWAWLPAMLPYGAKEVSLSQDRRAFVNPNDVHNQPFEMEGNWFIIWNGNYLMWDDATSAWQPYRPN